jgi:hypothetical protein
MNAKQKARWAKTRAKGRVRYVLLRTLWASLGFSTALASVISLFNSGFSLQKFVANWPVTLWKTCIVFGLLLGPLFALIEWIVSERMYADSEQTSKY